MTVPNTKGRGRGIEFLRALVGHIGDECVTWPFAKNHKGYGQLGYEGHSYKAHRLMCEIAHGAPPTPKHQSGHTCGNGHLSCVNPNHLEWKTNSANQIDRRKNGNMLRNKNGNRATIPPHHIAQIYVLRKEGMAQTAIAARFGVSLGCIQYWLKYRAVRGNDQGKIRAYTDQERKRIIDLRSRGATFATIAADLGRTIKGVKSQADRLAKTAPRS